MTAKHPHRPPDPSAFAVSLPLRARTVVESLAVATARTALRLYSRWSACARRRTSRAFLPRDRPPIVSVGGGGIFFFWQLGAAAALLAGADAGDVQWAGSSAGALCAALAVCRVPPRDAVLLASELARGAGVYERPLGLAGVWGGLIRRWLDELLPPDAAKRCSGRVAVHVTVAKGPWRGDLRVARVNKFESRESLIDALMASVHIPFFLDGRLWNRLKVSGRTMPAMDGSVLGFLPARRWFWGVRDEDLEITAEEGRGPDYFITHLADTEYLESAPMFTELLSLETALSMVDRGYQFTKQRIATVSLEDADGWDGMESQLD